MEFSTLSLRFFELQRLKHQLTNELNQINEKLDQAQTELVHWLENNHLTQVRAEEGTLFIRGEVYARIAEPMKAYAWLRSNGMGDIIKETVNGKTLSAIVKERGEIPGVASHYETKIGYRKRGVA